MVVLELDEKFTTSPQSFITVTPQVMGPFKTLCRWSGFDVSRCELKKSRNLPVSVIRIFLTFLLVFAFAFKFVSILFSEHHPLTLEWADVNMEMGMFGFALCSAVCIVLWTRAGFVQSFEEQLGRLKAFRVVRDDHLDEYRKDHIRMLLKGGVLMVIWIITASRHILYDLSTDTASLGYRVTVKTIFGFEPLVVFFMGIACCTAMSIFTLVHSHLLREITYFNEELQKASRSQQLTVPDIFAAYGKRHLNIILLVKHTNMHLGKLNAIGVFLLGIAAANTIFMMTSFMSHMPIGYKLEAIGWNVVSMTVTMSLLKKPGSVQEAISRTMCILLDDDTLPTATDQRIIHTFRMFTERCKNSTPIRFCAIAIDQHIMHQYMLIVPNIGTMMTLVRKLINQ